MKKKASLWISGITTVAMLAVAVGSFAAWDTLKGATGAMTVSTSTPVTITVTGTPESNAKKLVPADAAIVGTNESNDYVKIGTFKAKLTGEDASNGKSIKTQYTLKDGDQALDSSVYDVEIKDITNPDNPVVKGITDDLDLTTSEKTYEVNVKYIKTLTEEEMKSYTPSTLNLNIELEASKDNPTT